MDSVPLEKEDLPGKQESSRLEVHPGSSKQSILKAVLTKGETMARRKKMANWASSSASS